MQRFQLANHFGMLLNSPERGHLYPHLLPISIVLLSILLLASCAGKVSDGSGPQVTTLGSYEVTAKLLEIKGELPDIPLYDYAFIFKYQVQKVHRGKIDSDILYIGHYNPLKPRADVADVRSGDIGGNVKKIRVGDIHRMALEVPIEDYFMGGIVNRYFEDYSGPIYWAVWTNEVTG